MPRNPNGPHAHRCEPIQAHLSASENIKLQLMMTKLEDNLRDEFVLQKQLKTINSETLLGGGNIDITSIDRIEKASEGLVDTYTIYFNNAEPYSFVITNGAKGDTGPAGKDGLTTAVKVGEAVYEQVNGTITLPEFLTAHQALTFPTAKFVTKPIGDFIEGEDINGLSLTDLFTKLLGLSDIKPGENPGTPIEPEGVIEEIINNKLPMYSVNADGKVVELPWDAVVTYTAETVNEQPAKSGFYQITNTAGRVIESGYQELTVNNPNIPYVIALPIRVDFNTMVTTQTYDPLEDIWKDDPLEMSNNYDEISALCTELGVDISGVDRTHYTLWADLEAGPTGKIHRFIIVE